MFFVGVFGGPLLDVIKFDSDRYELTIPHIVYSCIEIIKEDGMAVEGIFRLVKACKYMILLLLG